MDESLPFDKPRVRLSGEIGEAQTFLGAAYSLMFKARLVARTSGSRFANLVNVLDNGRVVLRASVRGTDECVYVHAKPSVPLELGDEVSEQPPPYGYTFQPHYALVYALSYDESNVVYLPEVNRMYTPLLKKYLSSSKRMTDHVGSHRMWWNNATPATWPAKKDLTAKNAPAALIFGGSPYTSCIESMAYLYQNGGNSLGDWSRPSVRNVFGEEKLFLLGTEIDTEGYRVLGAALYEGWLVIVARGLADNTSYGDMIQYVRVAKSPEKKIRAKLAKGGHFKKIKREWTTILMPDPPNAVWSFAPDGKTAVAVTGQVAYSDSNQPYTHTLTLTKSPSTGELSASATKTQDRPSMVATRTDLTLLPDGASTAVLTILDGTTILAPEEGWVNSLGPRIVTEYQGNTGVCTDSWTTSSFSGSAAFMLEDQVLETLTFSGGFTVTDWGSSEPGVKDGTASGSFTSKQALLVGANPFTRVLAYVEVNTTTTVTGAGQVNDNWPYSVGNYYRYLSFTKEMTCRLVVWDEGVKRYVGDPWLVTKPDGVAVHLSYSYQSGTIDVHPPSLGVQDSQHGAWNAPANVFGGLYGETYEDVYYQTAASFFSSREPHSYLIDIPTTEGHRMFVGTLPTEAGAEGPEGTKDYEYQTYVAGKLNTAELNLKFTQIRMI